MRAITLLFFALFSSPIFAQEASVQFGSGRSELLVRSTTDVAIIAPILSAFSDQNTDLTINYEQWGSNTLYEQSQVDCENNSPQVDAIFSSAVHQMFDLVNHGCAATYQSEETLALSPARNWRNELWGLSEEPAVIIYNTDLISADEAPRSRFELLDLLRKDPNRYRGKIATYDIEASGLGYLFAFNDSLEATTFGALLEGFARTNAVATCCSTEIIQNVASGRFLIAYNVLGSYVQSNRVENVGVVLPEDYTLFLSRAFMIPKHSGNVQAAARLLDFMLSPEGKRLRRQTGLVYPNDAAETGLLASARRFIPLRPPLLVALDKHTKDLFINQWRSTFSAHTAP